MNYRNKQVGLIQPSIVWGGDQEKGLFLLPDWEGICELGFLPGFLSRFTKIQVQAWNNSFKLLMGDLGKLGEY